MHRPGTKAIGGNHMDPRAYPRTFAVILTLTLAAPGGALAADLRSSGRHGVGWKLERAFGGEDPREG